ncbi:DUF1127 domain-containing protein [Rouxiella sp. S1S-2]|uniref:DUF1127 domain-containing protein n=1 Tax=Rouxiella sp. S1S-2 TaxID=2653856 RepID=UPI001264E332|nr:DUF1127 domain-containing protein [Rouxiella sp. S1S-2]KAB7897100.1 DUF1127 domain-containing protein [Rouxiella sp. S1S-2]
MKRICECDQFTSQRVTSAAAEVSMHQSVESGEGKTTHVIDENKVNEKPGVWIAFVRAINHWHERRQTLKILRGLNSTQLKDIGLSCGDVDKLYGNRDDNRKVWPNWPK